MIGLTVIGIGLGRAVEEAAQPTLPVETRGLLAIGVTVWVFAGLALKLVSIRYMPSSRVFFRINVTGCIVAIMTFGANIPPLGLLGALVVVMLTYVVFEMRYWNAWSKRTQLESTQDEK